MATVTISTYDRANKGTSLSIGADDAVTDVNVQALADAIDPIIRGVAVKAVVTIPNVVDGGTPGPSTDKDAQRGNKWLFRVYDSVGQKTYTHEIGTADNTVLPTAADDFIDLTAGVGLALKTAWDAVYLSPDGNAGSLLSVQQVNRALN